MASKSVSWEASVVKACEAFAKKYGHVLKASERQLSASFEIGCFHAVLEFYKICGYTYTPANLVAGEYKYLTTPSGNPENFSYVVLSGADGEFELRQQVRVQSHVDSDICFTPDLVVVVKDAAISSVRRGDFASGKRPFFTVSSSSVVAAHECKSTNPFPELLVAFIGMLVAAHEWYPTGSGATITKASGHLAPTLFVGGTANPLHLKMISGMQRSYAMNVVCGLHKGTWGLKGASNRLIWNG